MAQREVLLETGPLERAAYVERPNRFVVRYRQGRRRGLAYLANPGRLGEILLPGTELLLAPRPHTSMGVEVVGATWKRRWSGDRSRTVFLSTGRINDVAESLLGRRLVPELEGFAVSRREYARDGSRFDFLLSGNGRSYLLEVKSVTLVERGLALFPDARTERGRRHLEELARWREGNGRRAGVLFLVQGPATRFLPDFHNDLEFARTFRSTLSRLDLLPYRLETSLTPDGRLRIHGRPRRLAVPEDLLAAGTVDGGLYLLLLALPEAKHLQVGSLGPRRFPAGHYIYVGSALRGLSRRVGRHVRQRKRLHWHVDFLRRACGKVQPLPIRAPPIDECALAAVVRGWAAREIEGFGSSDCGCSGHLFFFPRPPLADPGFQELLTRFRHAPR